MSFSLNKVLIHTSFVLMDAQVSAFQTSSGRALASCLANSWGVTRMMLSIVVGYCKHVRKPYTNLKNNFFFFFFFCGELTSSRRHLVQTR